MRRSRWRARRQPVRVATVKGGPGGGRISKARLAPSATAGCGVDLPDAGEGQCVRGVATPWRLQSWRRRCDRSGRRFVPPDKRPSTGVAARMGVSDPACRLHRRPWGGSAARSLTPDVSSPDCAGARAEIVSVCARECAHISRRNCVANDIVLPVYSSSVLSLSSLWFVRKSSSSTCRCPMWLGLATNAGVIWTDDVRRPRVGDRFMRGAVAPNSIVRDRLGASRVRSLRSPLSRP